MGWGGAVEENWVGVLDGYLEDGALGLDVIIEISVESNQDAARYGDLG